METLKAGWEKLKVLWNEHPITVTVVGIVLVALILV